MSVASNIAINIALARDRQTPPKPIASIELGLNHPRTRRGDITGFAINLRECQTSIEFSEFVKTVVYDLCSIEVDQAPFSVPPHGRIPL